VSSPRLTVVIPAYDEASRLPARLEEVARHLDAHPLWRPAEVLVVDDGSTDATAGVAAAAGARVLRHRANRGKGAAVRTGFAASRGEMVLLSDADRSTPMEELEALAREAAAGGVVAVGSRAVDRRRIVRRQPLYRDLMGRTFNLLVRAAFLPGIHDTQCGFKLLPGELARALARVQLLDGFAYDVELLARARAWGWRVVEVPVRWAHEEASRVRPLRHALEMLAELARLRVAGGLGAPGPGPRPAPEWLVAARDTLGS